MTFTGGPVISHSSMIPGDMRRGDGGRLYDAMAGCPAPDVCRVLSRDSRIVSRDTPHQRPERHLLSH